MLHRTTRMSALRFTFRLRFLLAVTFVVAIVSAYYSTSAIRQKQAVAQLVATSGEVQYDQHLYTGVSAWIRTCLAASLGDDVAYNAVSVTLSGTPIRTESSLQLRSLNHLAVLTIEDSQVSDLAMVDIGNCSSLRSLFMLN